MYQLAPNIELLFTEAGDYHDRVRAAAAAGFNAVEMWGPTGADAPATPKDIPALKAALEETGTQLTAQLAEPRTQFMIPPWDHSEFYRKLDEGVEIAQELGCPASSSAAAPASAAGSARCSSTSSSRSTRRRSRRSRAPASRSCSSRSTSGSTTRARSWTAPREARVRRARRRLALLRRAVRHLPLGRRGRGHGSRARERRRPHQVRAARGCARAAASPAAATLDWPSASASSAPSGYDGPIGLEYYPTARRRRRRSPSSGTLAASA